MYNHPRQNMGVLALVVPILFSSLPTYYGLKDGILPQGDTRPLWCTRTDLSCIGFNQVKICMWTALILGEKIQSCIWTLWFKALGELKAMVIHVLCDCCLRCGLLTLLQKKKKARGRTRNCILTFHSQIAKSWSDWARWGTSLNAIFVSCWGNFLDKADQRENLLAHATSPSENWLL